MADNLALNSLHIRDNVSATDPPTTNRVAEENSMENGMKNENEMHRMDFIDWDEYFMAVSFLSAQRSKDPATQVGACIVGPDRRIVGIGYNGMPRGCSDSLLPWGKSSPDELENKYMYVCHAEMNAILNKNSASVEGCTMYVALFPCNECAKMIVQSGIKHIIYFSDKHKGKTSTIASKRLLDLAGISYTQFKPRMRQLTIDFHSADPSVFDNPSESVLAATAVLSHASSDNPAES